MADQDFNIKVVTTADLTGLTDTQREMAKIRQQGLLAPIPAGLSGTTAAEEAAKTYPLLNQGATAAEKAANNALFMGANLGRARQEAIVLARELTTGGNVTRTLGSLLGALGPEIAVAAVGTFALYQGFKGSRDEALKLIEITDKLGAEIEATGKKQQDSIKAVTKPEDVTKVAETAIAEYDKVHAKNQEIQNKELNLFEKSVEFVRESFQRGVNVFSVSEDIVKPYTAQLNQIKANAQAEENAAAANVRNAIDRATKQREKVEGLEEEISSVDKLENQLKYLHGLQDSLDRSAKDYGQKWLDAQKNIANTEKELEKVLAAQTAIEKETAKRVKDTASDMSKTPDQFNREQAKAIDDRRAKIQAANAELKQMEYEGGPKTDIERSRQEELKKFISPESTRAFNEDLERRKLERYQALQENIIDPTRALSESLGPKGAKRYEDAQTRLAQLDANKRGRDETGGRTDEGSRIIAGKLDALLQLWR